ncbi:MAG TPA: polysaccharide deacetylase family protein [Candidatus Methylomirabilis sp.]|nr:polysaccharide deacetylase family protein [Candidatus Methylomirabilis sp.]
MHPWLIAMPPAAVAAAAGVVVYGAVHPRSQLFGSTICRTNSPRKLALTFDDGPNPAITPKLLELLDRYKARATFFIIGKFARECPELLKETAARGHVIGNHTDAHPNLFWLNADKITIELRCCNFSIKAATGAPPKWFRPPFGFRNPWVVRTARELNQRVVMWTLLPGDWRATSSEWLIPRFEPIASRAKRNLSSSGTPTASTGDILCLHDGGHRQLNADRLPTLAALEHWMPRWRDLGLEFVTIDEAVQTPAP